MTRPTADQVAWARRLLHRQAGAEAPGSTFTQVCRVLATALGPIIGGNGVRALMARSMKVASTEHAELRAALASATFTDDPASALNASLGGREPAEATTEAVFASCLALLSQLIGAHLTLQIMETAWNHSEEKVQ